MASRTQIKKPVPQEKQPEEQVAPAKTEAEILAETDELLDEIDGLLEINAEEFVANYVQKGGQ